MLIRHILLLALAALCLQACQKDLIGEAPKADPESVFYHIWKDFHENYGLFGPKGVDWFDLYQTLHQQVDPQSTTRELYDLTIALLSPLNDRHVTLYPASDPELPRWSVDLTEGGVYVTEDFDLEVVKDRYLTGLHEPLPYLQYGWAAPQIGYLHIQHMDGKQKDYEQALDEALQFFGDAEGLVLDLRDDAGGFDPISQYVAGRFASEKRLYMTSRKKNGPGSDDFTETEEWYVEPTGTSQFTRPIAVLTSGSTASAGETLLLALRTQGHITQFGATSSGNFSDAPMWEAPNGWTYTISVGDYRAADGQSYEGIGLSPQVEVLNQKEELQNGQDKALEKAIEWLQ